MAKNRIICTTNDVDYLSIRKAMTSGARTIEEIAELAGVCTECEGCKSELEAILSSVCGCKKVSLEAVVNAVKNGADTVEKVGEVTGAGTGVDEETGEECGKCKGLIQNIIDLGR
ncbi:(2Fe-2S)-binding protein [Dehalobacterium formicoaceticum]|uniref:Bacterioferritin-associated ferredoxin n=1 Tax=Dehalobacterium formicoaceticum TaxID=51515 RepID=A0ABT1Y6N6_9FIRM|nr:(2Fe-2S)-binding protein [Dehalobacterium formicoaceticum]MCR6546546.1 (2Fe-2S)-binding protein [Dehalobacterium formicoaceticum]